MDAGPSAYAALRRTRCLGGAWRVVATVLVVCAAWLGAGAGSAAAQGTGYSVTFVARWCSSYTDIFANRARNDIVESLKDLGPNTQYATSGQLINPTAESLPPQDRCQSLAGWEFTLGTTYRTRAVSGPWGSLSIVLNPFSRPSVVTQAETPLLNNSGVQVGSEQLAGATTIELTPAELTAAGSRSLWVQGGTPTDPILAQKFGVDGEPEYGFGTLRCAEDNYNGDNVEYVSFPTGVRHVFCYAFVVKPPPTSGTITIEKQVIGAPSHDDPAFPFGGNVSFNPNGFQLRNRESDTFYRAGGFDWTVEERPVADYRLSGLSCTAVGPGGGTGSSTVSVDGSEATIHLVAEEHVRCVYTNEWVPPHAGLTIRKVTTGGVGTFDYTITDATRGGEVAHARAATEEPNIAFDAQPSPLSLAPGRYVIHETSPSSPDGRWRADEVVCDGQILSRSRPVEIEAVSAQAIVCTFHNAFIPRGSISISKITEGGKGTASFLVAPFRGPTVRFFQTATTTTPGVAARATPNTPEDATDRLRLGTYRIVEQPPVSTTGTWLLTAVECNRVVVPFTQGATEVRLTRTSPHAHCVFTNKLVRAPTPPPPPGPEMPGPLPPVPPSPPPIFPPEVPGRPAYPLADLSVTKKTSAPAVTRGQVIEYRVKVTNHGPDPAEQVVLDDQPLGAASVVGVHTSVGHCQTRIPIVCRLGTLKAGARVTITIRLRLRTNASTLVNRAVVGAATQDPTLGNNVAEVRVRVLSPAPPPAPPPVGLG